MITTVNNPSSLPPHCEKLLAFLRDAGPVTVDDQGVFAVWKVTDLQALDILGAADFLYSVGKIDRAQTADGWRLWAKGEAR